MTRYERHRANYPQSTLTEAELNFVEHINMFGSAAYPVRKIGRKWSFERMFGAGGTPTLYKTKGEAEGVVQTYLKLLADKWAGRV